MNINIYKVKYSKNTITLTINHNDYSKINKLVKLSSMVYLLTGILLIPFVTTYGGILLTMGIILLSYSHLEPEKINNKKIPLIFIAIISLSLNQLVSILLFIAIGDINTSNKNKVMQQVEISSESKRVDILLKIGLGMIIISGILFATTSWEAISDIVKCISLMIMGITFLGLSKFSEIKLKIEKTTKAYYVIGQAFFLLTFIGIGVFGTISPWFSYIGEGKNLVYFLTFILLGTLLLLINNKFKDTQYKYIAYICGYLSLYHILIFMGLNIELTILVISVIILLINILIKDEKLSILKDINKTISYIYWPLIILTTKNDFGVVIAITSLINVINLLYIGAKKEDSIDNTLTIIISYILIANAILRLQLNNISIVLFIALTIFYMLINHNKINNSKYVKNTNQIVYHIITTILLIIISKNALELFICSIIYGIINIINCYITNKEDSKFDLYYQPVIILITTSSIINIVGDIYDILNKNDIYSYVIAAIIYAGINYLIKEEKIKKIYFIALIIITIYTSFINLISCNILIGIIITLLSIYIYRQKNNSTLAYILILYSILMLNAISSAYVLPGLITNILNIIIFGIITYIYKDNLKLKKINLIAIIIPLYFLVNCIGIEGDIRTILLSNVVSVNWKNATSPPP